MSVDLDYESIQMGGGGGMLLPGASGTAVTTALGNYPRGPTQDAESDSRT